MVNESLLTYVENVKEKGFSDTQIKEELKVSGWSDSDISEAFFIISSKEKEKAKRKLEPSDDFYFIPNNRNSNQFSAKKTSPGPILPPVLPKSDIINLDKKNTSSHQENKINIIIPSQSEEKKETATSLSTVPSAVILPKDTKAEIDVSLNSPTTPAIDHEKITDDELIKRVERSEIKSSLAKYIVGICVIIILAFCAIYYKKIISTVVQIKNNNQNASVISSQIRQVEIYLDYKSSHDIKTGNKSKYNSFVTFKGEVEVGESQIKDLSGVLEILSYGDKTHTFRFDMSKKNDVLLVSPIEFSNSSSLLAKSFGSALSTSITIDQKIFKDYISKFFEIDQNMLNEIGIEIFNQLNTSTASNSNSLNEKTLSLGDGINIKIQSRSNVSYAKQIQVKQSNSFVNGNTILENMYREFINTKIRSELQNIYSSISGTDKNVCTSPDFEILIDEFTDKYSGYQLSCKQGNANIILFAKSKDLNTEITCIDKTKKIITLKEEPKYYECK